MRDPSSIFCKIQATARPVNNAVYKTCIKSWHLVMAWINVGQGKAVDVDLAYGKTPVVKASIVVITDMTHPVFG